MGENSTNISQKVLNRLKGDKVIWIIVFFLSLISLLVVYSSSSSLAFKRHLSNFSIFFNQLKFVILGWAVMFACYKVPVKWYRILSIPSLWLTIGLLILTILVGKNINGAQRGLSLGGFTFQPSELAKVTVVLYLARIIEKNRIEDFKKFSINILAPLGILCVLIGWGSISMALLVGIIAFVVLIVTGVQTKFILRSGGILGILVVVLLLAHFSTGGKFLPRLKTATARIERFFEKDKSGDTKELTKEEIQSIADEHLQEDMARIAVVTGKITGKGPGKSTQRFILPHPYSDFVYSLIVEEYGLLFGLIVIILYMQLLYSCIKLSMVCKTVFSSVTVSGIGFGIVFQAFLHILVNVGILPITGHTLPLISLGGSSLIIIMGSIGIILSVSRTRESVEEEEREQKREEREKRLEQRRLESAKIAEEESENNAERVEYSENETNEDNI